MKKALIFLVLLSFVIGNVSAQGDVAPNKRLKSGFWLKLGYIATPSDFLYVEDYTHLGTKAADFGVNMQLGTTFYIGPRIANMLRFGLDVSWIDFSYIKLNSDMFENGSAFFLNLFEFGPKISFSPVKAIAFDMYGRFIPSLSLLNYDVGTINSSSKTYFGFHTSGLVGVSFRVGVFETGLEYNFGKMEYTNTDNDADKTSKLITDNIRILVGFKF